MINAKIAAHKRADKRAVGGRRPGAGGAPLRDSATVNAQGARNL